MFTLNLGFLLCFLVFFLVSHFVLSCLYCFALSFRFFHCSLLLLSLLDLILHRRWSSFSCVLFTCFCCLCIKVWVCFHDFTHTCFINVCCNYLSRLLCILFCQGFRIFFCWLCVCESVCIFNSTNKRSTSFACLPVIIMHLTN